MEKILMKLCKWNPKTKKRPYSNTLQGIENNVLDAIDLINTYYSYSMKDTNYIPYDYLAGLPKDDKNYTHFKEGITIMIYNGGYDPFSVYKAGMGNPHFIGDVGNVLGNYVPGLFGFEYRDNNLVVDLTELQARVNGQR